MKRKIFEIAQDIQKDWIKVNFAARPYLEAMYCLGDICDNYGQDSAKSIVLYFLSNASTYRGPKAKELKNELKQLFK